jgi:ribosomal protein S18 acetylase RimI-like enzyme
MLLGRYIFVAFCCAYVSHLTHATQSEVARISDLCVRLASPEDLGVLLEFDCKITDEYFKPLLLQYPEYHADTNEVERILAEELEKDIHWFPDCIARQKDQRLYVAHLGTTFVGFVVCHKQDESIVVVDLLMIDGSYRGQGIGRRLIQTAIETFPEASTCMLVVLDKNIQARAAYEKIGFSVMVEKPAFFQEKYSAPRFLCYSMLIR